MEAADAFPKMFDGTYYVYQGELDVTGQIELNGKGQLPNGNDATMNFDTLEAPKKTFEDIDGFEVIHGAGDKLYAIIQEDSGNDYGERMMITSALEHDNDGMELSYYFVAMSGGSANSRGSVGIPAGTACGASSHEFSGIFDLSGLLLKDENGEFVVSASDTGVAKRAADAMVDINDKNIVINLQAGNLHCGIIETFKLDR